MSAPHEFALRVYYEDTDAGGVVYYANYLKFAERARTEYLRALGFSQAALAAQEGVLIVVRACELACHAPARLDDEIRVQTQLRELKGARMSMHQSMVRGDRLLAEVSVQLVCVDTALKPRKWPAGLLGSFNKIL